MNKPQQEYRLLWEIELTADDPVSAAREARKIQRDPQSLAGCFMVYDSEDNRWDVDLDECNPLIDGPYRDDGTEVTVPTPE